MIKPSITKVVKYIADVIGCRGDIMFKKLIVKLLITAILYISFCSFGNIHFGTKANKVAKITDTGINIKSNSDSLPICINYNIKQLTSPLAKFFNCGLQVRSSLTLRMGVYWI